MKFGSTKTAPPSDSQSAITAKNYVDRAMDFIRAHDGEGFTIVAPDAPPKAGRQTPASWRAWIMYLGDLGVKTTYLRQVCVGTVPCEWPEDFDTRAPASDKLWAPFPAQQFSDEHCAAMRKRVAGLFHGLSAELEKPDPTRRHKPPPDARGVSDGAQRAAIAAANIAHANQLKAEYAANPIEASPYLRAQAKARAEASEARAASFGQV